MADEDKCGLVIFLIYANCRTAFILKAKLNPVAVSDTEAYKPKFNR
jgi:hypothetical protein